MASKFHAYSDLLALLDQRYKEMGFNKPLPAGAPWYRPPVWNAADMERIDCAVALHAQADKSDPYAGNRMRTHLLRGLDTAGEVMHAAQSALNARANAIAKAFEALV